MKHAGIHKAREDRWDAERRQADADVDRREAEEREDRYRRL